MARLTDTEQIRIYLKNHDGGVLDFSYLSKHVFSDISVDNLRKYISRISKERSLRKISKGIYLIGDSDLSDKERVVKYYTDYHRGFFSGDSLLYDYEIIDEKPEITEIITNQTEGNKFIQELGIQLYETKNDFFLIDIIGIMKAMELIHLSGRVPEENKIGIKLVITSLLEKHYSDHVFERHIKEIRYARPVYILLADYLKLLNKSNRVMDIYDTKFSLYNGKK